MKNTVVCALVAVATLGLTGSASAAFTPDTDLTEVNFAQASGIGDDAVIFGSGNDNGNFAVDRDATGNFEVGLRAKIPYTGSPSLIDPGTNVYNVGTNTIWNFDWTLNTNVLGSGGELGDYTYEFVFDHYTVADGRQTFSFDPINSAPYYDHAIGDNTTTESSRSYYNQAADATDYANLLTTMNVAQNSWRLNWVPGASDYNLLEDATYNITLSIMDGASTLASSNIWVNVGAGAPVVPLPGAAALGFLGMGLIGLRRRFQKTHVVA